MKSVQIDPAIYVDEEFRMFPMHSKKGRSGERTFSHASVEAQGWRRNMEDSTIMEEIKNDDGTTDNLYAVFDGHGGPEVSLFCKCVLPTILQWNLTKVFHTESSKDQKIKKALKKTLRSMDDIILSEQGKLILMFIVKLRKIPELFDQYFIWNEANLDKLLFQLRRIEHEFFDLNS